MRWATSRAITVVIAGLVCLSALEHVATAAAAETPDLPGQADSATMPPALRVVGTQILNTKDEPVLLRGVNTAALEWSSDGEGHIVETVRVAIEDWRVNHIRLPLSQDRWFGKAPEQNDEGKAYRALVDEIVTMCNSRGVYIILDLHWSNAGEWGQNIGQHSMPDKHSLAFWQDIAPIYANHPAVLYDLYNEPHDVSWDVWLNGGTITDRPNQPGQAAKTFEAVGMQRLLDAVRATGAKNVVVAGGLDWAYDFSGILEGRRLKDPDGHGVIYANHVYDNKGDSVFTWIAKMEKAAAQLPLIVSEFGGSGGPHRMRGWWGSSPANAMGDDWLLHVMQAIHDHQWSWTAWDMHVAAGPTLISDWDYTPTPGFGAYVKQLLVGTPPDYTPPDPAQLAKEVTSALPESSRFGGGELHGDWQIESGAGRRQRSVLSFFGDDENKLMGQWVDFRGVNDLEDVRFKDGQLSFFQSVRFREDEYKAVFAGSIEGETLSGRLSHGASQTKIEGQRTRSVPFVAGKWEIKFQAGDRDMTATLDIRTDPDGKLILAWADESGEHEITNVHYEQDKLTFNMKTKIEHRESEMVFKGTIRRETDSLAGVITSESGDFGALGKRIDSPLVGNWSLDVQSRRGDSRQRLKVNRDLSGMYGIFPIQSVRVEGDTVRFSIAMQFGPRSFEMNFEGTLTDSTLTGEIQAFGGTQRVTGKKLGR